MPDARDSIWSSSKAQLICFLGRVIVCYLNEEKKRWLVMSTVLFAMPGAMGRGVGSCLNRQEILIQIGLMGQLQALLADIEHLVLRTMNGGKIELDWHRFPYQHRHSAHFIYNTFPPLRCCKRL